LKRLTTGVVAVLLTLTAAGCGDKGGDAGSTGTSGSTATSADSGGSSDAVDWADKVCSGIKDDVAALSTQPDIDQSNPQAAKDGLVTYLGTLETSLDGMASAVTDAGDPPVDGGAEAVKGFTDTIATAKAAVTTAKGKIEAAPVDDPTAFAAAVSSVGEDLTALSNMDDPTKSFSDNKELNDAYNKAPACQELEGSSSSPTS
jgi:hypothetical protein